ncbi:hypothetical protein LG943_04555 [Streptomonospora sp. S1-112]|uniref:Uncharacterized protein n=1 Tax=Streptomonospora mangrovi TaxID=2883123 RepID=A0A9X3NKQ7_9ACTN|nr:hypothetical protein [Streptomonospora mangrovi]MDA0563604.1 hypothetical protein [Streptomonospora mangrovi]
MTRLICADETTSGGREAALVLDLAGERVSVREVIRRRVFQEAAEYNARASSGPFRGLVRPTEAEAVLNGPRGPVHPPVRVDPEEQFAAAVAAFSRNGFLVLTGERQLTDLDEEIELTPGLEVTFLKLVPLVGG